MWSNKRKGVGGKKRGPFMSAPGRPEYLTAKEREHLVDVKRVGAYGGRSF